MGGFQLLVSLEVAHAYFQEPRRLRLRFRPDAETQGWLDRTGCLTRQGPNALRVFFDTEARGGGAFPQRSDRLEELRFAVTAEDPMFASYTADLTPMEDEPACFLGGEAAAPGRSYPMAPAASAWSREGPRPHFTVRLPVPLTVADAGRAYRLELASRSTTWKYILTGDWADIEPCIVDAAGALAFHGPAAEPLADGRAGLMIRSKDPIPLMERPGQRLQLRAGPAGRVLIGRLPCARAGGLGLDPPDNPSGVVSEIYVAR